MLQRSNDGRRRDSHRLAFIILLTCLACALMANSVPAQQTTLPEGATVSALGRTAQVRSDGSFSISNVPSNIGSFRIRLIHPNGLTAESGCLTPVNRGFTFVPPLVFGPLTGLSSTLTLQSSQNTFTAQGQTAQLQVTGNLQAGGTADITNSPCSTYLSSNAFLATVSQTGLVTVLNMPLFPSTLVINVMNDGVVGTFSFQLQPNNDVDNDGMPNDYEVRNGFNPNFAGDAAQDADADGLTNLQEFQGSTAPRDPDTDRDGISDGANDPDGAGRIIAGPDPQPLQPETVPPTCVITSPVGNTTVIEGETIMVRALANDNVGVNRVIFSSTGFEFSDGSLPYEAPFVVPTGVTQVILNATARDIAGNPGAAAPVVLNVIPDPLTEVTGRVVNDSLMPLAGASVSVLGRMASTNANGIFSIPNVPTVQGNLIVSASFVTASGGQLTGTSAPTPPVRGGTTNVGDIVVVPALFESNIGTLVLRSDDGSVTRALPFSFSFYGNTYNQVFVNNNGNLSFNFAEGDFTETVSELLSRQPRISAFWDDLDPADFGDAASGLYVNDQLSGRLVVTWLRQLEFSQVPGPSTIQVILFSDGRIQFGYQGVASLDAVVGVSPGGLTLGDPRARTVDFSNTPSVSTASGEAIYEQFELPTPRGSTDPLGSGQNSNRNNPFDLDGGFILFTPKVGGGYDVRTILPPSMPNHGTVLGTLRDAAGGPVSNAEVEVLASRSPAFRAVTNTDAQGHYIFASVPCGSKIIVRGSKPGSADAHGVGEMPVGAGSVTIDLKPPPVGPAKN